jgi:hypothetical protein
MHNWLSFVTGGFAGPVCIAVTVVGLVLSGLAWRRKGFRSGIRGVAWSLLPAAAWLTHSLALLGHLVSAIVQFGAGFVLSPKAWLGVILVGVSAALFLVSGGIPLLQRGHRREKLARESQNGRAGSGSAGSGGAASGSAGSGGTSSQPAALPSRKQRASSDDDDLGDVKDILKRHGIT